MLYLSQRKGNETKETIMTDTNATTVNSRIEVKEIRKETKFVIFVTLFLVAGILLNLILVAVLPKNTVDTMSIVDLAVFLAVGGLIGSLLFLRSKKNRQRVKK